MPTALVLSPHLDDAAFSCGGLMAVLGDAGWRTVMATAFTRSMPNPTGFALACQTDKGLAPGMDYMALRREEDRAAAAILGAEPRWLDLPEAPHRGYHSVPALFGPVLHGDDIWRPLAALVAELAAELRPDLVLAPQGLGSHVDHRQMIQAVLAVPGLPEVVPRVAWYRDTPYAIRNQSALPDVRVCGLTPCVAGVGAGLDRKAAASCAYASQLGFQFGGPAAAEHALRAFAATEGGGRAGERFLGMLPDGIAVYPEQAPGAKVPGSSGAGG